MRSFLFGLTFMIFGILTFCDKLFQNFPHQNFSLRSKIQLCYIFLKQSTLSKTEEEANSLPNVLMKISLNYDNSKVYIIHMHS